MLGCLFIVSGFEKIISPYQNFLYVVQSYEIFGEFLEEVVARIVPWFEFLLGVFLLLGLWTEQALQALLVMITGFLGIVGQALIRKLPITECGCFGEMLSLPLPVVLAFDAALWVVGIVLLFKINETTSLSLDKYFLTNDSVK